MSQPEQTPVTLGIVGDDSYLHQKTQKQLKAVLGEYFLCRPAEPKDTSVEVLVFTGEELLAQSIMEALLAGFPPARIVAVTRDLHELQGICLGELNISFVVAGPKGNFGSEVVARIRSALGHLGDPPLARSRIEETLGQLDTQKTETFRGRAFKRRLSKLKLSGPGRSGLDVSVIPGKQNPFPSFGSCQGGEDVIILHATEAGLMGLDPNEHALFTQALVHQCVEEHQPNVSFTKKFVEAARSILGWEEPYRTALLIFRPSVQTLEILLTGNLDLLLLNPSRFPSVGLTRSPGIALKGTRASFLGKERRQKLTSGDHLILMPSGWLPANQVNPKERTDALLAFAERGHLPDLLSVGIAAETGAALVVTWRQKETGEESKWKSDEY